MVRRADETIGQKRERDKETKLVASRSKKTGKSKKEVRTDLAAERRNIYGEASIQILKKRLDDLLDSGDYRDSTWHDSGGWIRTDQLLDLVKTPRTWKGRELSYAFLIKLLNSAWHMGLVEKDGGYGGSSVKWRYEHPTIDKKRKALEKRKERDKKEAKAAIKKLGLKESHTSDYYSISGASLRAAAKKI